MILGLSLSTFTLLHVIISLVALVSGLFVLFGMLGGKRLDNWTALFLVTTVLTSASGFLFPASGFTPAQGVGIISLVLLAAAIIALYVTRLTGPWRWIYVIGAVVALFSTRSSRSCRASRR